jgi:hypothetical protein
MTLAPYLALALLAPTADAPANPHEQNVLFQEMLTKGVPISKTETWKMPPPYMPDGLDAAAQEAVIAGLAKGLFKIEDVYENSPVAPHYLSPLDKPLKNSDPKAPAYPVDVWFVAYGNLKKLASKNPQQLLTGNPAEAEATILEEDDLAKRMIELKLTRPPLREQWVHTSAKLMDTVEVSSTRHSIVSQTDESLVVASQVDPRFAKDPMYANFWQMLPDPAVGRNQKGPPQPLEVGAFYLKITKLKDPNHPNALFVELHQVSTEPKEWFNGAPILRGKIPIWVKDEVQKFRRTARRTVD